MIHNSYHEIKKSIGSHEQESVINIQQRIAKELTDRLGVKNTSSIAYKKLSVELSALIAKQEALTSAIVKMLYDKEQDIAGIMANTDFEEQPIKTSAAKNATKASDNATITNPSLTLAPTLTNFINDKTLKQEYEGILAVLFRMMSELENLTQQIYQEEQELIHTITKSQLETNTVMAIETLCEVISSAFTSDEESQQTSEETLSTKLALAPKYAKKVDDEFSALQKSYQHFDTLHKDCATSLENLANFQPKLRSALHAEFQPRKTDAEQAASLISALESRIPLFQSNKPTPVRTAQAKEDLYESPLVPSAGSFLN